VSANPGARVATPLGSFYAFCLDTIRAMFKRGFPAREFVQQAWFVANVSVLPALFTSIPFAALVIFQLNILLQELGALDLSGAAAGFGIVTQQAPVTTVLIVAGAGATSMTADIGARKIREELDAMEVMGIDVLQRLVVPRVLALTVISPFLFGLVSLIGVASAFLFAVIQGATPGQFIATLSLLTGGPEVVISEAKAVTFGLLAALVACYRGLTVEGGPKGVGQAVNETLVYSFMLLFLANAIITALGFVFTGTS
jgi:phospholipid/cholesterol/gamma-HCH transport system permease protein